MQEAHAPTDQRHRGSYPMNASQPKLIEPITPTGQADEVAAELVDRAEISNGKHIVLLSKTEADIAELRAKAAAMTFSCATVKEDKATRQFRALCVSMRVRVKEHCEDLRRPAKQFGEDVLAEQRRLTALIAEIEAVPEKVIRDDEEAKEKRKAEETTRKAEISKRIQELTGLPLQHVSSDSNTLALLVADLELRDLAEPPEEFGEFLQMAQEARSAALAALLKLRDAAEEREALAAHAAAQTEQAERDRAANEERAAQLASLETERIAAERVAAEQVAAAQATAESARKALAEAEAALQRANDKAREATEAAAAKVRETRAQAAAELYAALVAVFSDAGFDALHAETRGKVTTALHAATFAKSKPAAEEVAHV